MSLPRDITSSRLREWAAPRGLCLGATDAETERRIRALAAEVLRLQAVQAVPVRGED